MIIDLHSHTNYSNCGIDEPENLVIAMIENGVSVLGVCDHNYGIGDRTRQYINDIRTLAKKYEDKIKVYCGIEVCTRPGLEPGAYCDFSQFDYCLIEDLDNPSSVMGGDVISFVKNFRCPVGIAHTDIFGFIESKGYEPFKYLSELAKNNIFWELNVNYDSIHRFREHEYVKKFFVSEWQQEVVKLSGIKVSIGFDGHNLLDYDAKRVFDANKKIEELKIKNAITLFRR